MTVRSTKDGTIELAGRCGVEDAESLQGHLLAVPESTVEWGSCEHLHSAVLQVLLIAKPPIRGVPSSAFLRTHIEPLLRSSPG
jgi:hypothetical protein